MREQSQFGFDFAPREVPREVVSEEPKAVDPLACPRCGGRSQKSIRPQEMGGERYCPVCQGEDGCFYFTPMTGQEIVTKAFDEATEEQLRQIGEEIGVELTEPSEEEQPALFEGFAPVNKNTEQEIPWTKYVRMVQMFFDGPKFEEFRGQISRLAAKYGSKNLTDTVAEAVRRAAH